jgi:hypothetical protein
MPLPDYEHSYIWGGKTVGDAHQAPYASKYFMFYLMSMARYCFGRKYGVLYNNHANYSGNLAATNPAGTTVRIASGAALNVGFLYLNDANVDFNCSNVGHYHIVLRAVISQQTVRLTMLGPSPGQYPPPVHTGDINDISIALVGSSIGGVIAVRDRRRFFRNLSLPVHSGEQYYWYIPGSSKRIHGAMIECGSTEPEKTTLTMSTAKFPRPYTGGTAPIVMLQAAGGANKPGATKLIGRVNDGQNVDYYLDDTSNLVCIWWLSFGVYR